MTHRTAARLFEYGEFTSHSGNTLKFKLEWDAFDMDDCNSIASIIMTYQTEPFRSVEGIPRGGIPLADALRKYATGDPTHQPMLVDDVFTTGKSFIDFKPKCFKNSTSVIQVTGLPGVSRLPAGFIHLISNRESRVPLKTGFPLIFSISALVTG